ncbi:MAG: hypothetical protein CSB13_01100 [Chloroflexi bacterium]|nr:MAG: hypothetical protein CSB13_01100 [Chloroflexota bacterium]
MEMIEKVIDQQVMEEAIATLERHRRILGDDVVETAVTALQEQASLTEFAPSIQQYDTVTVLQADISGFTAMSAKMDAEQVRDALNALWQRLDNVVLSWGGQIEQHTGDGLTALFGVPVAQEDDAQRAVLAALDMQLELSLFNEEASEPTDTSPLGRLQPRTDFRMRIGVHCGSLLLRRVGQSVGQTAVGDTVQVVGRLEKQCPVGSVLITYDVYRQVFGLFDVESGGLLSLSEDDELPVYEVKKEKSRALQTQVYQGYGFKAGFVGRIPELERIEFALQETLDSSVMQVVTVTGEVGIGKTRFFDEFERWLEMLPVRVCLMRARSEQSEQDQPYAAFRQLFMNYFEIHQRSTLSVVLEKFSRGVARSAGTHAVSTQEQAHVMGQLLGFDFSHSAYVKNLEDVPEKLKQYGMQDLARFFTDLSAQYMPIVILFEDAQWVDEASLAAIEYLLEYCYDLPIMIVCLARPSFLQKRPLWGVGDDPLSPYLKLSLPSLSAVEGGHIVADILRNMPHLPSRLSDLVVFSAKGNPLYLEQFIRLLYDDDIIQFREEGDQVNLGRLEELGVFNTLADLYFARVMLLTELEKDILKAASIVGREFWDAAILEILEGENAVSKETLQSVLAGLEQRELIVRQRASLLADGSQYTFTHDLLHDVVYQQVSTFALEERHALLADWLITRMKPHQISSFVPMIAAHYEKAGQQAVAAQWRERE